MGCRASHTMKHFTRNESTGITGNEALESHTKIRTSASSSLQQGERITQSEGGKHLGYAGYEICTCHAAVSPFEWQRWAGKGLLFWFGHYQSSASQCKTATAEVPMPPAEPQIAATSHLCCSGTRTQISSRDRELRDPGLHACHHCLLAFVLLTQAGSREWGVTGLCWDHRGHLSIILPFWYKEISG